MDYVLENEDYWVSLYLYKNKFLRDYGFQEHDSFRFYRELFPSGSLQNKGEHLQDVSIHKGNIIGINIDKEIGKSKNYIITDDLEGLKNVINIPFGLIAPVTYFGKNKCETFTFRD